MPEFGHPDERLWAKKFKSPEDLEQGYDNLYDLSINTFREKEALEARVRELEMGHTERTDPSVRAAERQAPQELLSEVGVPVDALSQFIDARFQEVLSPVVRGVNARAEIVRRYPDYDKAEQQLVEYINGNPNVRQEYEKAYQASPLVAMEWAYGQYQRAGGKAANPAAEEVAARLDARLQGSYDRSGQQTADETELARAKEHFERTGDSGPLMRLRLRHVVSEEHLRGLPGT
jgi:hypothetical protein